VLADLREKLKPFYSETGRPSIDPELMLRMLIVGYCYGIRFERKLCERVDLSVGRGERSLAERPMSASPFLIAAAVAHTIR
jgi:Transposase domain (DUF772)